MTPDVVMVIDRSAEAWRSEPILVAVWEKTFGDLSRCSASVARILKSSMHVKVTIVRMQIVLPRFSMTQAVHS